MKKKLTVLALTLLYALCVGCEDQDILDDAGFQFWSGGELTTWTIVTGEVEKIPTWNPHDFAVGMVGAPVILQQTVEISTSYRCLRFEMIADFDAATESVVSVDWLTSAASVIHTDTHAVATHGYDEVTWTLDIPSSAYDVRVSIIKAKDGDAAVAQLRGLKTDDCF